MHALNPKKFAGMWLDIEPIVFPEDTVAEGLGLLVPEDMELTTLVKPRGILSAVGTLHA